MNLKNLVCKELFIFNHLYKSRIVIFQFYNLGKINFRLFKESEYLSHFNQK